MSDATAAFAAGAISGVIEGVCIQPLELIKTRFQINEGPPMQFWPTVRDIIR
jgi:solute carrier family 25 2-oxodicarboxylate transporter 21